jgi:hypothetical protein
MRPTFRRAAIVALVVASLAPGLVQGRTFNGSSRILSVEVGRGGGFLGMAWSLLADVIAGRAPGMSLAGSLIVAKDTGDTGTGDTGDNGGRLDPNGVRTNDTAPPDNGGRLDPNG